MISPSTRTGPVARTHWQLDDDVVRFRVWGTDSVYDLPDPQQGRWTIGAAQDCDVQLVDLQGHVSRRHAILSRQQGRWVISDARSKNGIWLDNARLSSFVLQPGAEVGIGSLRLIAESGRLIALRAYVSRLIGWDVERQGQVDRALRALRTSGSGRAPLMLYGDDDLVSIARALHRRVVGDHLPFIVCDPRRIRPSATTRSPENRTEVRGAMHAAGGGTLCVWASRLPDRFELVGHQLEQADPGFRLTICAHATETPRDSACPTIALSPVNERPSEIDRLIDEYAADAVATLGAKPESYTIEDHMWLRSRRPRSLTDIEISMLRLIAIREWGGITRAATHLGVTHAALSRWLSRRRS